MRLLIQISMLLLVCAMPVHAHGAPRPPYEGAWWSAWNFKQPLVMTNLGVMTLLYCVGLARVWSKAGFGKTIRVRQACMFSAGMVALVIALFSPVDVYSDELAWMHMIQHMMLMGVAAPVLVLGTPFLVILWAFPLSARRAYGAIKRKVERWRAGRYFFWQPVAMWLLFGLTLWVWHLPVLYEATLYDDLVHDFQHFSFVIVSCFFWRVLLDPVSRLKMGRGMGVIYLFLTSMHATILGVFMTLAPKIWYPFYEDRAPRWKLTALEDQQVAGLIMWMPACMIYALVAALLLGLLLREDSDGGDLRAPEE